MDHYEIFNQLHHQPHPFILANAWNAKSAQVAESKGFKAIGTSSGAIAGSLGYADGEKIPFAELLYIVKRIRSVINIPLSVDMERGYTNDLEELTTNIQQLLDIGVAGINIEDAQGEAMYLKKLRSIREYLSKTGQRLFINARTDVFVQKLEPPLDITLKRAEIYRAAGADGLFVAGIQDPGMIREIVSATKLPVNVVGTAKLSSPGLLAECGVKRISMAPFLYKATYKQMENIAEKIIAERSLACLY